MKEVNVVCDNCGKLFLRDIYIFNTALKKKNKQFCSSDCRKEHLHKQTMFETTCSCCGKVITRSKKDVENSKSGKFFCSRSCSAKTVQVGRKQTDSTKEKISKSIKVFSKTEEFEKINNRNKQKYIDKRIKRICPICSKEFFVVKCVSHRIYCSRMCCNNDKEHKYKKVGVGGYRKGSGRGKKGWYKGYYCDSSWELAYVIFNLEHDIKFTRNHEGFEYLYNNETHKYYPDFILEDGTYIELKGYMTKQNQVKISSFKKSLKVLCKQEMQEYLKYVVDKYGKDYIEMYEGNPHKHNNKCLICGKPAKNKYCSRSCAGKEKRKKKKEKRKWITNEIENKKIKYEEEIPEGWRLGCKGEKGIISDGKRIYRNTKCPVCGKLKSDYSNTCSKECCAKLKEKFNWDSIDLIEMYKTKTMQVIADDLNVARTTILKKLRKQRSKLVSS